MCLQQADISAYAAKKLSINIKSNNLIFDPCHFTFSAHVALKGLLPEVLVLVLNQALFPGKSLHTDIALERTLAYFEKIYVGIL